MSADHETATIWPSGVRAMSVKLPAGLCQRILPSTPARTTKQSGPDAAQTTAATPSPSAISRRVWSNGHGALPSTLPCSSSRTRAGAFAVWKMSTAETQTPGRKTNDVPSVLNGARPCGVPSAAKRATVHWLSPDAWPTSWMMADTLPSGLAARP